MARARWFTSPSPHPPPGHAPPLPPSAPPPRPHRHPFYRIPMRAPPADASAPPPDSARAFAGASLVGFAAAAGLGAFLAARTGLPCFRALGLLSGWCALIALACALPRLPWRLREPLLALGGAAALGPPVWQHLRARLGFGGASTAELQLAAVTLAIAAFLLFFLGSYAAHAARERPAHALSALGPLARLLSLAHAATLGVLLANLHLGRIWFHPLALALLGVTLALVAEAALQTTLRLYQPRRLRPAGVLGHGALAPALFGRSGPLRRLGENFERTFGVRLGEAWLVRFAGALAAPLALLGLLGLWFSTAVTAVPVDSRGVLLVRGEFRENALPPGLHFHAPWPWSRIVLVPTERVREISLGFERDLAGPVLWAEKHFEGEQNLLVGQGEELLTINVPVHYRVRDAVAYLRHTGDAAAALDALGYHELLGVTATHTAFDLMTTEREEVSARLRAGLQAAVDRLGLGLEIVFVGLKDVHPPVPVAPAYQDVVSAEEQQVSLVDQARAHAARTESAARVAATQARLQADSAAALRLALAGGETARFLAPLDTWEAHRDVFATRLRLESVEAALAEIRRLWIVPAGARRRGGFFLGGEASSAPLPALAAPSAPAAGATR